MRGLPITTSALEKGLTEDEAWVIACIRLKCSQRKGFTIPQNFVNWKLPSSFVEMAEGHAVTQLYRLDDIFLFSSHKALKKSILILDLFIEAP